MARVTKIARLPPEIRDLIGRLRDNGRTGDEILEKLRELDADVSRTRLYEHLKQWDKVRDRLHASKAAAEAIMARLEVEGADDRVARLNIATLHANVMQLFAGEDGEPVVLGPKDAKLISETLRNLASAAKSDQDRIVALKKELAKETAKTVEKVAGEAAAAGKPLDGAEVLRKIREDVYGIFER